MAQSGFGIGDFAARWIFAQVLVLASFNPTEWSYARWAASSWESDLPLVAFFGVVLLIGWIIFLRATLRSIGLVGIALILALGGTLLWVLIDRGLLTVDDVGVLTWVGLVLLGLILGLGMSWSHVRRALTGQADVDDVDA
ncbi:MAG: DUF6524 family protein [Pseudomonadota bacterium]